MHEEEEDSVSVMTYPNLSPGGGVMDGEVTSSPGCSGISASAGEPGPCKPGGVDEVFRASVDEPLRETQEVSITRTPILEANTHRVVIIRQYEVSGGGGVVRRDTGKGHGTVPLYFPNAALVGEKRGKRDTRLEVIRA